MTQTKEKLMALDVGERRIGVALADSAIRFPFPLTTLQVDGNEIVAIEKLISEHQIDRIVIGWPRNQQGEETQQTQSVRSFAERLKDLSVTVVFQDESLTSVLAEKYLKESKKRYTKEDIDAHAASIILGDYLESNYAI